MIETQIAARGIHRKTVLAARRKVPGQAFLPARIAEFAYEDAPLPIDAGQTMSQPYVVALMIDALDLMGGETVLEIGTGAGYAATVPIRSALVRMREPSPRLPSGMVRWK